jgi:hypothetical protein
VSRLARLPSRGHLAEKRAFWLTRRPFVGLKDLDMNDEDRERAALTPLDYVAAGVEAPNWAGDPMPSLETWRAWQAAQNTALDFKRAKARAK